MREYRKTGDLGISQLVMEGKKGKKITSYLFKHYNNCINNFFAKVFKIWRRASEFLLVLLSTTTFRSSMATTLTTLVSLRW